MNKQSQSMNTTTTAPSGCPFATLSRYGPIAAAQPFCHSLVMLLLSFLRSVKEFFLGPDFEFETFSPPPMWLYKLFREYQFTLSSFSLLSLFLLSFFSSILLLIVFWRG
eukprot:TRINITY_DN75_c0_g1_i1.p1 TRINITY_DN75_c0_g1~~TRINITY_DN75_c0_g1_i1.p1  ORF type:complete len:120 (+),score=22.59 TRINITY_DN75_c0_g1_i1:36-362(+)